MKKAKPNDVILETVCTDHKGYLRYNKIIEENIKTQELYSIFALAKNT